MSLIKIFTGAIAGGVIAVGAALAEHHDPTMSMISVFELDPSQEKSFDDAWMTIKEVAEANDYPYSEFVGGHRNMRWIVTPISKFADVDAVFEARNAVDEAGGKKMEKALDAFNAALTDSHTFFVRYAPDLSYQTDADEGGPYMEIDTFHIRYGKRDKAETLLKEYKALMEEKNSPYSYSVSWDSLGTQGNSFTIVSYAQDAVAMAERDAAMNAMLDGDKKAEDIFSRFLKISTGSETMHGRRNAEASINLPDGG